ncbi:MAG: cellulase family glycosylhydrolase, partial [Gammaproteobacteria bacterium]|nr:cellulase family glycosylhydrolase [Gammaproteobacteria bacterium]
MGKLIKQYVCELGNHFFSGKQTFSSVKDYYGSILDPDIIHSKYDYFFDVEKREVLFRGINVAAKIPLFSHKKNPEMISFTNTPFSVEEAPEHFSRLKYLGFNLFRWVVPWEAICPNEPERYDTNYLNYLDNIIDLAQKYGFSVLIDFHQDVWSRFTGGSGAPLWTLEKMGLNVNQFEESLAAIRHGKKSDFPLGHLFWHTNADRYAAKTMYTLFFGGKTFAPGFNVDGMNAQDFLQTHYIEAIALCANKLRHHDNVIGYDIMNEPHLGFIGCKDLTKPHGLFRLGPSPLPLQAFAMAEGNPQKIDVYEKKLFGLKCTHKLNCNASKANIFEDGVCIWRKQGIWAYDQKKPILLRRNYFSASDPNEQFYLPFIKRACKRLSSINSEKISFIEHVTNHPIPAVKKLPYKIGFSGHWYDAFVISMRKVWNFISVDMMTQKIKVSLPYFVQNSLSSQIFRLLKKVEKFAGKVPFLLSEFGIPFDLNKKKAYASGNYRKQKEGLERSFK